MKPELILIAERVVLLVGAAAMVVALGAVEWRLGLFAGGALLVLSTSPWRNLR